MAAFAAGGADVLVATTVIEVGIDVPNATVMLVEGAERYGISQLHQLRGRVGRGEHASLCLLFGPKESARLRALAAHSDGFELAAGRPRAARRGRARRHAPVGPRAVRVARLPEDEPLAEPARAYAEALLAADPELERARARAARRRAGRRLRRGAAAAAAGVTRGTDAQRGWASRRALAGRSGDEGRRRRSTAGGGSWRRRATRRGPTSDRVREALFACSAPVDGRARARPVRRLGALGIEALSRGAAAAVFVDRAPAAIAAIRANLEALGIEADVRRMRRARGAAHGGQPGRGIRSGLPRPSVPARRPSWGGSSRRRSPRCSRRGRASSAESDRRAPLELALP